QIGIGKTFGLLAVEPRRGRRTPPLGRQPVLGRIHTNPVQPRIERTVPAEVRQGPIGLDERFLRHILDFSWISDQTADQAYQLALILGDEQAERLFVATLNALNEQLIRFTVSHGPVLFLNRYSRRR